MGILKKCSMFINEVQNPYFRKHLPHFKVAPRVLMVLPSPGLDAPSEGGWAWMIALSGFMVNALTYGVIRSMGVFYMEFVYSFHKPSSEVSWITSISITVLQFASPVGSALSIQYGDRAVVMAGGVLTFLGTLLASFGNSLLHLYLTMGALTGFGWALVFSPTMAIIPQYFHRRRGLALGLALTGNGLSSILFSPLFQALIDIYSWRGALLIISAIELNLCICGALLRPVHLLQDHHRGRVETEKSSKCASFLRKLASDLDLSLFRNCGYVLYQAAMFLYFAGTFMVYAHLVLHGKEMGLSSYEAAFLMSVTGLADTCFRPLSGWFADLKLLTTLQLSVLWSSATGLSLLFLPLTNTFPGIMALSFIYGLNNGANTPLFFATLPDLVTIERTTSAVGLSMMLNSFSALLGPPFSGFLRDLTGGFTVSFLVFGGLTLVASGIILCVHLFLTRNSLPCLVKKSSELQCNENEPSASRTLMRLSSMDQSTDISKTTELCTVSS
ncbi:monocarboxylate transporter 13-like [Lissotriton helveticus]